MVIAFVKQIIRFGIFLMPVFLSLSCASASEEFLMGAVLSDATSPTVNAVVWIEDDNGQRASFWIHGKNYEFGIVAMHSEMVFPIGESLWLWQESDEALPLCDCAVWRLQDFKGDCPESMEPAVRTGIVFTNLNTGEEEKLELGPQIDFGRPDKISEFGSEVELIASVGPYLFISYGERGYSCIAGESLQTKGFIVFNLETMQVTDILSDSERKRIEKNEQKTAFQIMRGDNLVSVLGPEELELTAIVPTYHPSYGVALTYQFSKSVTFGGQHSGAYSRQISVPAQILPKKLIPFLLLPQVVHNFMINTMDTQFGGWTPISCPVDRMDVLLETFRTSQ